jgi:hypothetical protein
MELFQPCVLQIRTPVPTWCLLRQETQLLNVPGIEIYRLFGDGCDDDDSVAKAAAAAATTTIIVATIVIHVAHTHASSISPSAWNNWAPTGRIFMKLGI